MLKNILSSKVLILICFINIISADFIICDKQNNAQYSAKQIKVEKYLIQDENILVALRKLGNITDTFICIEDYKSPDELYLRKKKVSVELKNQTLENILDVLSKDKEYFQWKISGKTINIISSKVVNEISDNPLDKMVAPFKFSGTLDDLNLKLDKISSNITFVFFYYSKADKKRRIQLDIRENKTLRKVLNNITETIKTTWTCVFRDLKLKSKTPLLKKTVVIFKS